MNGILLSEIILFVIALTMDSFVISFAYGISKCKPSLGVVIMMNGVCSLVLGIALIAGGFLGTLIPDWVTKQICFVLLLLVGGYKVIAACRKKETVDQTEIKELSWTEGFLLALALSLDGLVAGVGAGLLYSNKLLLVACSFVAGIAVMLLGWMLGYRCRHFIRRDLSWISGACLLLLALRTIMGV